MHNDDGKPAQETAQEKKRGVSFSVLNTITVSLSIILAVGLFFMAGLISSTNEELQAATREYIESNNAAADFSEASNYQSTQARMFALTDDPDYLRRYLIEDRDTKRQEHAFESFKQHAKSDSAQKFFDSAVKRSEELSKIEQYALKLIVTSENISPEQGASELSDITLTPGDDALSRGRQKGKAKELLFGDSYQESRDFIDRMVRECQKALEHATYENQAAIEGRLRNYLFAQSVLAVLMLASTICASIAHVILIRKPLKSYTSQINDNVPLETEGAAELQLLARAYNSMYEENQKHQASLQFEAEHDSLTGLLNRTAYDKLYAAHSSKQALLLIDMDYFKDVNDDFGHDVGDKALAAVAKVLRTVFRATDYPCRMGGDEFAVIMAGVDSTLRPVVEERLLSIRKHLEDIDPSLPTITLSIGVAFSEDADEHTSVYKAADLALYSVKETGRDGYAFYSDIAQKLNRS